MNDNKPIKNKSNPKSKPRTKNTTRSRPEITLADLCKQVEQIEDERLIFEFRGKHYALLTLEEFEYFEDIEEHMDYESVQSPLDEMEQMNDQDPQLFQIGPLPDPKKTQH